MQLKVLSSNSSGNCYLLEAQDATLILECGVRFSEIKKALDFDLTKVAGCLVSHSHKDHSKSMADVAKTGIWVYANQHTRETIEDGLTRIKVQELLPLEVYNIGPFTVRPFEAKHDVPTLGFLIHHREMGTALFLTDSYYTPYRFPGVDHMIIEANYCEDIIQQKAECGTLHHGLRDRVFTSHLSIQSCLKLLRANDTRNVKNIVLIHLSESNSDAQSFKQQVQDITGKTTTIARPGVTVQLNQGAGF